MSAKSLIYPNIFSSFGLNVVANTKTRIMKLLSIVMLIFLGFSVNAQNGVLDKAEAALKTGNHKALSDLFAESIDLTVKSENDVFSQSQAEQVLKNFFSKNKVKSYRTLHNGESRQGFKYAVGEIETSTGTYRVTIHIKEIKGKTVIHQLRIE